jgi:hypothetical protein
MLLPTSRGVTGDQDSASSQEVFEHKILVARNCTMGWY